MKDFKVMCATSRHAFEAWLTSSGHGRYTLVAIQRFVRLAASLFELFLQIHPFVDGNGHIARALVYGLMVQAGYGPMGWDIHEKKDCEEALNEFRRGDKAALEKFLMGKLFSPRAAT